MLKVWPFFVDRIEAILEQGLGGAVHEAEFVFGGNDDFGDFSFAVDFEDEVEF